MATPNISHLNHMTSVTAPWHLLDRLLQAVGESLSLPALPLHIHYIYLSTIFYYVSYRYILPRLSSWLSPKRYPTFSARLKLDWDLCAISMLQSLLNSSMAIFLCLSDSSLQTMTWKERIWGYDSRTGAVLGAAIGYFIFHLGEAIVHMHLQGPIFVFHGAACVLLCGVAFRPVGMCYTPVFLLMEIPNIFLNIQKFLDKNELRDSQVRLWNRYLLLATYFICRPVLGTYFQGLLFWDITRALLVSDPKISADHLLGAPVGVYAGDLCAVAPVPIWMAAIQLSSISLLNAQGLYWFSKLLRSIHYNPSPSAKEPRLKN